VDREVVRRHLIAIDATVKYLRRYRFATSVALAADQGAL
jgi:hypothetical protein